MRAFRIWSPNLTADQLSGAAPLLGGSGCVTWHSSQETSGSASADYLLSDNQNFDQTLMYVTLSAGQSTRDYIGLHALPFTGGLWLQANDALVLTVVGYTDHVCEDVLSAHQSILRVEGAAALATLAALGGP